jgi:hypothetical protein
MFLERNESGSGSAPTSKISTLEKWSSRNGWRQRSETYDAVRQEQRIQRTEDIENKGYAQRTERLAALDRQARKLELELEDPELRWIDKGETICAGSDLVEGKFVRVFNFPLLKEYRGVLDDMAKEVGDRKSSAIDIERLDVTVVKGYARVDSAGHEFLGPEAWATAREAGQAKVVEQIAPVAQAAPALGAAPKEAASVAADATLAADQGTASGAGQ